MPKDRLMQLSTQLNRGIITEIEAVNKSISMIHACNEYLSPKQIAMETSLTEITKSKELLVVRLIQVGNDEKVKALKLFDSICSDYF